MRTRMPQSFSTTEWCQVAGCEQKLQAKPFFMRCKVCPYHSQVSWVEMGGSMMRFCHLCKRFQELHLFKDNRRSCSSIMDLHNSRRRERRAAARKTAEGRQGGAGPVLTLVAAHPTDSPAPGWRDPVWWLLARPSAVPGAASLASVLTQQVQQLAEEVPSLNILLHRQGPARGPAGAWLAVPADTLIPSTANVAMAAGPHRHPPAASHQALPAGVPVPVATEPAQHAVELHSPCRREPEGRTHWQDSFSFKCTVGAPAPPSPAAEPAPSQLLHSATALELPLSTSREGGSPATPLSRIFQGAAATAQSGGLAPVPCTPVLPSLECMTPRCPAACKSLSVASSEMSPLHALPGPAPPPTAGVQVELVRLLRQPQKADPPYPARLAPVAAGPRGRRRPQPSLSPAELEELLAWLPHWVDDDSWQDTGGHFQWELLQPA